MIGRADIIIPYHVNMIGRADIVIAALVLTLFINIYGSEYAKRRGIDFYYAIRVIVDYSNTCICA